MNLFLRIRKKNYINIIHILKKKRSLNASLSKLFYLVLQHLNIIAEKLERPQISHCPLYLWDVIIKIVRMFVPMEVTRYLFLQFVEY